MIGPLELGIKGPVSLSQNPFFSLFLPTKTCETSCFRRWLERVVCDGCPRNPKPSTEVFEERGIKSYPMTLSHSSKSLSCAGLRSHISCAFLSLLAQSCAGQVWIPSFFIQRVYAIVRSAGGLCVADEVQTGFGRMGDVYWSFQSLGLMPDIITTGKSIGNGYPMACVIASLPVTKAFQQQGMEYFNSCSGTNTAAAVGLAVLDVIEQEKLMHHAQRVGKMLLGQLRELARECPLIHDVRGQGLFLGIELRLPSSNMRRPAARGVAVAAVVASSPAPQPQLLQYPCRPLPRCSRSSIPCSSLSAGALCSWLCSALMLCSPLGVLVGSDGPGHNVIKVKPPMLFNERDAGYFVECLRITLRALEEMHPCCFLEQAQSPAATVPRARL